MVYNFGETETLLNLLIFQSSRYLVQEHQDFQEFVQIRISLIKDYKFDNLQILYQVLILSIEYIRFAIEKSSF